MLVFCDNPWFKIFWTTLKYSKKNGLNFKNQEIEQAVNGIFKYFDFKNKSFLNTMLKQSGKAGDRIQRNTFGYFVIHFSLVAYCTIEA